MISPHGITSALLLAWNGSAGKTRGAINTVLGLAPGTEPQPLNRAWAALDHSLLISNSKIELANANSLWARQNFELQLTFVERMLDVFGAEIRNLDFSSDEASRIVNRWVIANTGGKIESILPDAIPSRVVLYILNAVYFKGQWSEMFDADVTRDRAFHCDNGKLQQVPMMERSGRWSYLEHDGLQAVRLPYGEGRFAMYLVLPAAGRISEWLTDLDPPTWEAFVSLMTEAEGRVILPRFRFGFSAGLRPPLRTLGMGVAFSNSADFSAMTPRPVAISEVLHKTFIEVNEEGSEVSAATSVEVSDVEVGPPPFKLLADRPFFFAVADDKSGSLFFVGVVRSLDSF